MLLPILAGVAGCGGGGSTPATLTSSSGISSSVIAATSPTTAAAVAKATATPTGAATAAAGAKPVATGTPTSTATPAGTATAAGTAKPAATATPAVAASNAQTRANFLGAFYRPQGAPPFGVFAATSPQAAPVPYPTPGSVLFGSSGYCDAVAANGQSITSGYTVDPTKLANIVNLGVKWTRTEPAPFNDDLSHTLGVYAFGDFDSAQCALERNGITPVVGLDAGPVQYDATPGTFSPTQVAFYQTASDFGQWCGVVAAHDRAAFPNVTHFSLPYNEVDDSPSPFPGGNAQLAAYSKACYAAIKAANPNAFVYGFELNMDGGINVPAFITALNALGCAVGTCYDGISMHLSMVYPTPAASTPCYPSAGGAYDMACVTAVEVAANVFHVLISESVYTVPGSVPTEAAKALAVVGELQAYAANSTIDGVLYANVDECALYTTGFFSGGCLINTAGQILPAYTALATLANSEFP
jgi:hypothetical protein